MSGAETRAKIVSDPDYVYLKRYGFSLTTALQRYPEGMPDKVIAQALLITEEEVREIWDGIVQKLRDKMGVAV